MNKRKGSLIVSIIPLIFARSWQLTWILAGTMVINALLQSVSRINTLFSLVLSLFVNYLIGLLSKPFLNKFFPPQSQTDNMTVDYVKSMFIFLIAGFLSALLAYLFDIKFIASDFKPLDKYFAYTAMVSLFSLHLLIIMIISKKR